eukprot:Amastigsp_a187_12.p4 type:complete len:102 gc:universal Amastigsp_a187_12:319-624(+)
MNSRERVCGARVSRRCWMASGLLYADATIRWSRAMRTPSAIVAVCAGSESLSAASALSSPAAANNSCTRSTMSAAKSRSGVEAPAAAARVTTKVSRVAHTP